MRAITVGQRQILPPLRDATGSVGLRASGHSEELALSAFLVTADGLDPVEPVDPVPSVDPLDPVEPSDPPWEPDSDFLGLVVLVSELDRESFR